MTTPQLPPSTSSLPPLPLLLPSSSSSLPPPSSLPPSPLTLLPPQMQNELMRKQLENENLKHNLDIEKTELEQQKKVCTREKNCTELYQLLCLPVESGGIHEDGASRDPRSAETSAITAAETGGGTANETGPGESPAAVRQTLLPCML